MKTESLSEKSWGRLFFLRKWIWTYRQPTVFRCIQLERCSYFDFTAKHWLNFSMLWWWSAPRWIRANSGFERCIWVKSFLKLCRGAVWGNWKEEKKKIYVGKPLGKPLSIIEEVFYLFTYLLSFILHIVFFIYQRLF